MKTKWFEIKMTGDGVSNDPVCGCDASEFTWSRTTKSGWCWIGFGVYDAGESFMLWLGNIVLSGWRDSLRDDPEVVGGV